MARALQAPRHRPRPRGPRFVTPPPPAAREVRAGASALTRALVLGLVSLALAGTARAQDQIRAGFRVDDGQPPHAGLPFDLSLIVEGFDETPAPAQPTLTIPNAKVTPLGAKPSVSQSIQFINGRRTDSRSVRWVMSYRVEATQAGVLKVPSTTIVQGAKKAVAAGGDVQVSAIASTDDMRLELKLPERPIWVGETVPVELSWLLRRNVQDQTLVVPMLSRDDDFLIAAPPIDNARQKLTFAAGARELDLPFVQDQVEIGGARYTRFRFTFYASPRRPGRVEIGASSVVAALAVGRPDIFGQAPTKLFRVADRPRALEVRDLPLTDRPPSFAGAVGSTFDLSTSASRSVVQLGEPVELTITVRSDQRLDTLAPPPLVGEGGLPSDRFQLPSDPPTGELSEDGKTKTFKVAVQVTGPATEIPALVFSYFDPVKGGYQTARSQPIALAVRGGSIVSAKDVVSAAPTGATPATPAAAPAVVESMAGADLVLSSPSLTTSTPLRGAPLLLVLALLYGVPLGLFALRSWQRRTATQRGEAAEVRAARRRVAAALSDAATAPGRESAGPLGEALRALAKALQQSTAGTAIDRLETEAYAPGAATSPLSAELRAELAELVASWGRRRPASRAGGKGAAVVVALLVLAAGGRAEAKAGASASEVLAQARQHYERAMAMPTSQISERRAQFGQAQEAFAAAARALPGRPELLTDWGNAALNAGDVATATLAYRRALLVDGEQPRAARNLALLRSKQSESYRADAASATGTLFFFHLWPRARRLLVGALAFAVAILLLVPWRRAAPEDDAAAGARGWRRTARALALAPFTVWAAMSMSLLLEDRHADDAVVMSSVVLRAADSAGAPAALSQPLPRGAEVTVVSRRDSWARVRLPSGSAGWVPSSAVELIVER